MKVTVLPYLCAVFLMMYLKSRRLSACLTIGAYFMSISAWPPVATSWCCASISSPHSIMFSIISLRRSWKWSIGGQGK